MISSDKYGLSSVELEDIISVLRKNDKIDKAILFGSRAKGNYSKGSDIDISLLGNDLQINDILDISIKIDELDFPYKFDLIIYNTIKEKALIEHIDRVGVLLFEKIQS